MRNIILVLGLIIAILFGIGLKNRAEADTEVSFGVFFDALAPYGNWVSVPGYGYAWHPYDAGPDWKPYSYGRWSWSDYGWVWITDEPWGWATYHYGRWVFDDYYGWIWLPGTVWAPSWVTWYTGPGYIGWAPLPPDYDFFYYDYGYYGYGHKHYHHYYTKPSHCVFVPSHHFLHHDIRSVVVNQSRNVTIIKNTNKVTNIKLVNNKLVNYGPSISQVEKSTGAKIRKINVVERDLTVVRGGKNVNKLESREYRVFRPKIVKEGNEAPVIEKDVKKSPIQLDSRSKQVVPHYQKSVNKKENLPSLREIKKPHGQEYKIKPVNNNLLQTRDEESRIPKSKKSVDRERSVRPNNNFGNSLENKKNAVTSYSNTYSEGGYQAYRKVTKENPVKTRDLTRSKKMDKSSYSPPKLKEEPSSGSRNNLSNRKSYNQRDSKINLQNDSKSSVYKYSPSKRTLTNQGSFRKGPVNIRH